MSGGMPGGGNPGGRQPGYGPQGPQSGYGQPASGHYQQQQQPYPSGPHQAAPMSQPYPQQGMPPQQGGFLQRPQVAANGPPVVKLSGVTKTFERSSGAVSVLTNVNLDIPQGGYVALMGPSGSGKSTLLNLIAGLDRPSSGSIEIAGSRVDSMNDRALAAWRSRTVGFIFQTYNLMPVLTALENVQLPLLLTKLGSAERKQRATTALKAVGLEERMGHYPRMLSGGQEQRVAIARAIVTDPPLIIADEPTGDLDRKSADEILGLMEKLNREFGKTIVMVTHDPAAAERAHVTRRLNKGQIE